MKFLCDACKTKYQIDDDKVAGKTVRMKCRKCEHLIEIRSPAGAAPATLGAPQSRRTPTVPPPPASSAAAPKAPLRAPPKPGPIRAPAPTRPLLAGASSASSSTSSSTGTFRAQGSASNPLNPPTQNMVRPGVAPFQGRAPTAPQQRPGAPRVAAAASAARPQAPTVDPDAITAGSGQLADALAAHAAALDSLGDPPAPAKWFVALEGAPVGPLLATDLQKHVESGAMTGETLAWREGQGDWRKASEIGELSALFELRHGSRPHSGVLPRTPLASSVEPEPETVMDQIPDDLVRAARVAMNEPHRPGPFHSDPFAGGGDPFGGGSDPFAPAPFVAPNHAPSEVAAAAMASGIDGGGFHAGGAPLTAGNEISGMAAPHAGFASAGVAGPSFDDVAPHQQKKAVPWIPITMVFAAVAFGITAAVVLFLPKPPAKVADEPKPAAIVPSTPSKADPIPPPEPSAPAAEPEDPKVAQNQKGSSGSSSKGASGSSAAAAASNPGGAADLSKLLSPGGSGSGPSANSGGAGGGGGGSLSQQQIERTVQSYMPGVKRGCWDNSTAQSGDVRASIVIGGSGAVQSVSTQSGDAALARCIETKVKGWKFPPPGGSQTVNVPFKFLRQ